MCVTVSPEIEARILAKAEEGGISVDDYLDQLVHENEEIASVVDRLESLPPALSRDEVEEKLGRGLAQYERGEYADGEQFMQELIREIDQGSDRTRRTG